MKRLALIIFGLLALIVLVYAVVVATYDTFGGKGESSALIELALEKAGIEDPTWQSAAVVATRVIDAPIDTVWDAWSHLEGWPNWSSSLHQSTRWLGEARWEKDSEFEQVLDLGFPVGINTGQEKIGFVDPGRRVMWWKDNDGIKACHIWDFEPIGNGQTRISNVEVFHGIPIGILKPIVIGNWQQKFDVGLDSFANQIL